MKTNTVKLGEAQLRGIIAESVRKVLSERYLEPGTADYETDKIAKDLKRSYPQYESFVDEYVYGGYYEQYARMSGYIGVREGFREFVKKKQHGYIAESVKKVLKEGNEAETELFTKICELHRLLDTTQYRDALGIENLHLKNISAELRPLLQKAIRILKPYVRS